MTRELWTSEIAAQHDRRAVFRAMFPRLFGFDARFGLARRHASSCSGCARRSATRASRTMQIPLHLDRDRFRDRQPGRVLQRAARSTRSARASPCRSCSARGRSTAACISTATCPIRCRWAWRCAKAPSVIVAMGFESPYQEHISTAGRFAFQVSAILSQQPAEVAVLVPRARAPRRDHLDHSAVQAAHQAVRHREDSRTSSRKASAPPKSRFRT